MLNSLDKRLVQFVQNETDLGEYSPEKVSASMIKIGLTSFQILNNIPDKEFNEISLQIASILLSSRIKQSINKAENLSN